MAVILKNLYKTHVIGNSRKCVAENINATFPNGSCVGLLGRNGAGKSTLLNMISGRISPDSGQVIHQGTVSWPVGFAGSFHPDLTGAQNTRFIARLYGVDTDELCDFVEEFSELGAHFRLPFRTYSSGMRARLAFGISMGIHFDIYLVDEITAVGDAAFKKKSTQYFKDRLAKSGAIMVSHSLGSIRELCDQAAILESGRLTWYDDIEAAIAEHNKNMGTA